MAGDAKAQDGQGVERPLTVQRPRGRRLHAWFADHGRVASDTSLFVSQRLMSSFLVWLMIGVALTLPGLLWIAQSNAQAFNQQWQGSAGLTVYMKLAASEQLIDDMETRLNGEIGVERVIRTTPIRPCRRC
jgi:cell division protein FtsX